MPEALAEYEAALRINPASAEVQYDLAEAGADGKACGGHYTSGSRAQCAPGCGTGQRVTGEVEGGTVGLYA